MTVQERFPEAIEHYQAADRLARNKTAKCYAANAVTIATKLGFSCFSKHGPALTKRSPSTSGP